MSHSIFTPHTFLKAAAPYGVFIKCNLWPGGVANIEERPRRQDFIELLSNLVLCLNLIYVLTRT